MSIKSILLASAVAAVALPGVALAGPTTNLGGFNVPVDMVGHADGSVTVNLDNINPADSGTFENVQIFGVVNTIGTSTVQNNDLNVTGNLLPGSATYSNGSVPANGLELTYIIDIDISSVTPNGTGGFIVEASSGSVNYYSDTFGDFDGTIGSAGNGDLWLSATFVRSELFSVTASQLAHESDPGNPNDAGVQFAVTEVPGTFGANFNTNNGFDNGTEVGDFITFSISAGGTGIISETGVLNGTLNGDTSTEFVAISEPATLGLLGLGLVGLGFAGRRRKA